MEFEITKDVKYRFIRHQAIKYGLIASILLLLILSFFLSFRLAIGIALITFVAISLLSFLLLYLLLFGEDPTYKRLEKKLHDTILFHTVCLVTLGEKQVFSYLFLSQDKLYLITKRKKDRLEITISKEEVKTYVKEEEKRINLVLTDGNVLQVLPLDFIKLLEILQKQSFEVEYERGI